MTYSELYSAYTVFRRNKHDSRELVNFEYDLTQNLLALLVDINAHTYRHGPYRILAISEKKRRNLAIAPIRDRIVHRLIYDRLVQVFDKSFDPDVFSARPGKGLHKALARTQTLLKKHPHSSIWRLDIEKFYEHVDHAIMKTILTARSSPLSPLCHTVIDSFPVGIPIGNLTSQVFSNIYLNEFDRFVRHGLTPQSYIRYGDDALLFFKNRHSAFASQKQGSAFLKAQLNLTLNPKNNLIVSANRPIHFLGHAITRNYIFTDKHTTRSVLGRVDPTNVASYKSLNLVKASKSTLDHLLLSQISDLLKK